MRLGAELALPVAVAQDHRQAVALLQRPADERVTPEQAERARRHGDGPGRDAQVAGAQCHRHEVRLKRFEAVERAHGGADVECIAFEEGGRPRRASHLWAETYDRAFAPEDGFALQDELVPRIVSTVADMQGVLARSMSEAVRSRPPDELSPYEAVLRSFGYFERLTGEDLAAARAGLEAALQTAPTYADAWAMLALLGAQEYGQGFTLEADPLGRALTAARRAVELAPSSHLAHFSLAQALFFQREIGSFRSAAERAAALNPMDGNSIAFLGELLTYAGNIECGLELAARAKQLNPNHPGWYWYTDFYDAYRRSDYRGALAFLTKVNLPDHWAVPASNAAACAQLGQREAAGKACTPPASASTGLRRHRAQRHREVVGARLRGADDRRLAQGGP